MFCKLSQKGFEFEGKLMVVVYIFSDLISYNLELKPSGKNIDLEHFEH